MKDTVTLRMAGVEIAVQGPRGIMAQVRVWAKDVQRLSELPVVARHHVLLEQADVEDAGVTQVLLRGAGPAQVLLGPGCVVRLMDSSQSWTLAYRDPPVSARHGVPYSVLTGLKALATLLILEHGGLVVHACAFPVGTAGVLAAGPSGAGKSTLASLVAGVPHGDELIAVWPGPGGLALCATPFFGSDTQPYQPAMPKLWRAGLRLARANQAYVAPMDRVQGSKHLVRHVAVPEGSPELEAKVFQRALTFAAAVPWWELAFELNRERVNRALAALVENAHSAG